MTEKDGKLAILIDGNPSFHIDLDHMTEMLLDEDVYILATTEDMMAHLEEIHQIIPLSSYISI